MPPTELPFFARLWMAFVCFWQVLLKPSFALAIRPQYDGLLKGELPAGEPPPKPVVVIAKPAEPPAYQAHASGLMILSMLQREGRFIDFLQEEVAGFSDADVGGVARVVHEGCRKVLRQYVALESVMKDGEGAKVTVPAGFDANRIRLTGNVAGNPPFTGTLKHQGWAVTEVKLPKPAEGLDARVLQPAEVEI